MRKLLILSFGLLGIGLAHSQTVSSPTPTVGVITATKQPVYNEQTYVGRIQAPQIVALNARVTGYLEQQNFRDGDTVAKGQLLYLIEQPPYQAAVAQAQAAVAQAQASSRNANLTLGRAQALLNSPAGQQSTVDASRAAAQGGSASIASAVAQLQVAQINLGYTQIRAPVDGRISATNVDVGNVVSPSSGVLATIVSEDPIYVDFALPVIDALQLRARSAAQGGLNAVNVLVQLPDGRMYGPHGSIDFVNNQVTQATDTLAMRSTIGNPPIPGISNADTDQRELADGEFVNVILRDRQPQQQITVPQQAVVPDQLGAYVILVDNNDIARRQNVTTGQSTPGSIVVLTGIKPGDRVVVDGVQRVHPGAKVKPMPASAASLTSSGIE